jgi:hypothetical protein
MKCYTRFPTLRDFVTTVTNIRTTQKAYFWPAEYLEASSQQPVYIGLERPLDHRELDSRSRNLILRGNVPFPGTVDVDLTSYFLLPRCRYRHNAIITLQAAISHSLTSGIGTSSTQQTRTQTYW